MELEEGTKQKVEEAIEKSPSKKFNNNPGADNFSEKRLPYYEIYERNGEINEQMFNEIKGIKGGDKNKYFFIVS